MAKVFTGKVVIAGDQIQNYLQALEAAEAARAPFRENLEKLNQEFSNFLATQYVPKTVRKPLGWMVATPGIRIKLNCPICLSLK